MRKIVKPHKVRKTPPSTSLAQYKGGKDKYQYPYESQLNVPIKMPGNKYNLSPKQLAGISDEYSPLVYNPKQYIEDFKMFGPDIFIDKDVERANQMLDDGYGFFEMSPLQEVVVTPDYDLIRKVQRIIPNKSLRTALYQLAEDYTKKHSSNYGVNRLLDLYQYAGKPSVREVNTGIYSIIPSKYPNGEPRAFYNPSFDTMYLRRNQETLHQYGDSYSPDDLAAELAHPYHLKVSDKSVLQTIAESLIRGRADKKINGKTAYQRHGDVEYQTHQIVQPEMRNYVDSEESLSSLNKRLQKRLKNDNEYDQGKDGDRRFDEKKGTWRMTNDQVISGTAFRKDGKVYIDQGDGNVVQVDDSDHIIYPLQYSSVFDGSLDNTVNTINAMTGGVTNRLSPTQNARMLYDTYQLLNGNLSGEDWRNSLIYGNNGIVTDTFAQEHPYLTAGINLLGDASAGLSPRLMRAGIKTAFGSKDISPVYEIPNTTPIKTLKELNDRLITALADTDIDLNNPVGKGMSKQVYASKNSPGDYVYKIVGFDEFSGTVPFKNNRQVRIYSDNVDLKSEIPGFLPEEVVGQIKIGNARKPILKQKKLELRNTRENVKNKGGQNLIEEHGKSAFEEIKTNLENAGYKDKGSGFKKGGIEIFDIDDKLHNIDYSADGTPYVYDASINIPLSEKFKYIYKNDNSPIFINPIPHLAQEASNNYDGGKDKKGLVQRTVDYNVWRQNLPKNLQKETPDYDLYGAFDAGLQPEWDEKDKSYHLGSRDSKTGKILKKPSHPTFSKAIYTDMSLGYLPVYEDGDIYTINPFEYNSGKDSGMHIKKSNRGKFTAAAKRAGMGVQAYARKILSAPKGKYSPTLRRRAAFAKAASKFKH